MTDPSPQKTPEPAPSRLIPALPDSHKRTGMDTDGTPHPEEQAPPETLKKNDTAASSDSIPTPESTAKDALLDEDAQPQSHGDSLRVGEPPSTENGETNVKTESEAQSELGVKRRDSETPQDDASTPKPKRSRKLQGVGVKKPLYSRYETLYIIKAYKTLSEKHPNLVLIDLFKIVAILFNDEGLRQGFKDRTPDQLYQKYKRIQHGLNHGETEFLKYFKRNRYNPKEWIPDFTEVQEDQVLQYIKFPKLDEAANEVLGYSISNLKPPLPDLYDDEDVDEDHDSASNEQAEPDAEEELLRLAGYDRPTPAPSQETIELVKRVAVLEERLKNKDEELDILREGHIHKDTEIAFLKSMLKEDLSYIRLKLQERDERK